MTKSSRLLEAHVITAWCMTWVSPASASISFVHGLSDSHSTEEIGTKLKQTHEDDEPPRRTPSSVRARVIACGAMSVLFHLRRLSRKREVPASRLDSARASMATRRDRQRAAQGFLERWLVPAFERERPRAEGLKAIWCPSQAVSTTPGYINSWSGRGVRTRLGVDEDDGAFALRGAVPSGRNLRLRPEEEASRIFGG